MTPTPTFTPPTRPPYTQVGPIKGIEKLNYDQPDQYGEIIPEQGLWDKGPSGSTAVFVEGSNSIEVGYETR